MFDFTFGEEDKKEQEEQQAHKSQLLKELEEVDKKYQADPTGVEDEDTSLGLTFLEADPRPREELEAEARRQVEEADRTEKQKLTEEAAREISDLDRQRAETEQAGAEARAGLEQAYADRKKEAEQQALSRGLARSSIIMGQIEEFDRGKLDDLGALEQSLLSELSGLSERRADLERERDNAISELDLTAAARISEALSALEQEERERLEEIVKYNNTLTEKQTKYDADRRDAAWSKRNQALSNLSQAELQKMIGEEKVEKVKAYYAGLSPQAALEDLLADAELQKILGSYYAYLVSYYRNRI